MSPSPPPIPHRRLAPAGWTMEAAEAAARGRGLVLTPEHWQILGCAREEGLSSGRTPDIGFLARRAGIPATQVEALFPGDSRALVAELAGLVPPSRDGSA